MPGEYLLDQGGESDIKSIALGTLESRHIPNEIRNEWEPSELKAALDKCKKQFPNIEVRSVTAIYNCVGMVFATRRTWIEPELVPQLLSDDKYAKLGDVSSAQLGDVAVYRKADGTIMHVGIICKRIEDFEKAEVTFKVLSKWGPWAEFIHDPQDIWDSWGSLSEIWTDRKRL